MSEMRARVTKRPMTGAEYLEGLRDGREIWLYGERVKDVTMHPAFRNAARMVARLYDALHENSARRKPMVSVPVYCPYCQRTEVIKAGKHANGTQRYRCQNDRCARRIFLLHYQDRGRVPEVRRQVVDIALNGSGIRDTARVLCISHTTVIAV